MALGIVDRDYEIIRDAFEASIAAETKEHDRWLVRAMAEPWHLTILSSNWPIVPGAPGTSFACPLEFARRLSEELQQDAREGGLLVYPAFLQAINLWPERGTTEQVNGAQSIYLRGSRGEHSAADFQGDARSAQMCRQYARDQEARRLGYPFEWPSAFCGTAWVAVRCLTQGACARRFFVCTLRDLPERLGRLAAISEADLGPEKGKKVQEWTYLVSCWRQRDVAQWDMREEAEAWLYCDLARDERHRTDFFRRAQIARQPISPRTPKSFAARHADEIMFGRADSVSSEGLGSIALRRPCARELRMIRRAYRRQKQEKEKERNESEKRKEKAVPLTESGWMSRSASFEKEDLSHFQRSWLKRHGDCDTPDNSDHEEDHDDRLGGFGRRKQEEWEYKQDHASRCDAMNAHLLDLSWEKYLGKRTIEGTAAILSQTQDACIRDNEALRALEKVAEKEAQLAISLGMSWELYLSVRDALKPGKTWYALDRRCDIVDLGPEWKNHARGIEYAWRRDPITLQEYLRRTEERSSLSLYDLAPAQEPGCRLARYGNIGHRDPLDSCNHLSYDEPV